MRRSSKLSLSPYAVYFSVGVVVGLIIGGIAGYLARGISSDDRDIVIQQDIWNASNGDVRLEDLLDGEPLQNPIPAEDSPILDENWREDSAPEPDSTPPENQAIDATPDVDPSPENPSTDTVYPGGLKLSPDPDTSYDAPNP